MGELGLRQRDEDAGAVADAHGELARGESFAHLGALLLRHAPVDDLEQSATYSKYYRGRGVACRSGVGAAWCTVKLESVCSMVRVVHT